MRLLIDESVKGHIARALDGRFEILRVVALASGAADPAVVALAAELAAVLLTEDRGMPWTAMHAPAKPAGLVVIEVEGMSRSQQAARVATAMAEMGPEVIGMLTIIRRDTFRRRILEIA